MRRFNLECAIATSFGTNRAFARAVGVSDSAVSRWVECKGAPSPAMRRAISRAFDLSPGADCDEVVESDLDWLLEPVDELAFIERELPLCDGWS